MGRRPIDQSGFGLKEKTHIVPQFGGRNPMCASQTVKLFSKYQANQFVRTETEGNDGNKQAC